MDSGIRVDLFVDLRWVQKFLEINAGSFSSSFRLVSIFSSIINFSLFLHSEKRSKFAGVSDALYFLCRRAFFLHKLSVSESNQGGLPWSFIVILGM